MTNVFDFIHQQIAYRFSVAINKEHSTKRNCLIAGSLICFDESSGSKPQIFFLQHFNISTKLRGEHATILLKPTIVYDFQIRIKSKKIDEINEFCQALLIAKQDYISNFQVCKSVFPVTVKGQDGTFLPSFLIIFEKNFELQSEDGILHYSESLMGHPDVVISPDDPLLLVDYRNGKEIFTFRCQDYVELAMIVHLVNKDGPAIVITKRTKKRKGIEEIKEEIMKQPIPEINDEDEATSVSESSVSMSSVSVSSISLAKNEGHFTKLLANRSAYRRLRSSVFKSFFDKTVPIYDTPHDFTPMSGGYSAEQMKDLQFIPDINMTMEKINEKHFSSFDEKMMFKLQKLEDFQCAYSPPLKGNDAIYAAIEYYRMKDPIIAENPLPKLAPTLEKNAAKRLEFDFCKLTDIKCLPSKEPEVDPREMLNKAGYNISQFPETKEKPESIEEKFFFEFGKSTEEEAPAMYSAALLHGCTNIQDVYNGLLSIRFYMSEVSKCISEHPFSTFEECCYFFFCLYNLACISEFFKSLEKEELFKSRYYHADALINLNGFCTALSGIDVSDKISTYTTTKPPMFFAVDYSMRIKELIGLYVSSRYNQWILPYNESSAVVSIVSTITSFYADSKERINSVWDLFNGAFKALNKKINDKTIETCFTDAINNQSCQTKASKFASVVLQMLINKKLTKFCLLTWSAMIYDITKTFKLPQKPSTEVLSFFLSIHRLQEEICIPQDFSIYSASNEIAQVLSKQAK